MPTPAVKPEPTLSRHWRETVRLAERGDIEEAMLAILRLPDKLAGHKQAPEIDYRLLADYVEGLAPEEPLERTVAGLVDANCLYRVGDTLPAQERFAVVRSDAGRIKDETRGSCLVALAACGEAQAAMRAGNRKAAARRARAAVETAEDVGADWLRAFAQHTLGRILSIEPTQRSRAQTLLEEARDAYRSPTIKDLRGEAYVLHILGRLRADDGDTEGALDMLHHGLALMRRSRAMRGAATLLIDIGWLRTYQQSHALARNYGREALESLDRCNDFRGLAKACHLIGWTHLSEDALDEAYAAFERASEYADTTDCAALEAACHYHLARCAFRMGHDKDCRRYLRKAINLEGHDPLTDASVQALVAADTVRRRRWKAASGLLRRLTGDLRSLRVPRIEADGLFLCGFELCRQGRPAQAAPLIRQALEVAEASQASGAVQAFLSAAGGIGIDKWLGALASAVEVGAESQQQLVDYTSAATFGFHDLKNTASGIRNTILLHKLDPKRHPLDLDALDAHAEETEAFARDLEQASLAGEYLMKPQLEPFDMAAWAQDQANIGNTYPRGGLTYETDIEAGLPLVMADPRAMARIVGNFRSNAERYAPNSEITLSVKGRRDKAGDVVAVIFGFADTGPGIHPQDIEILFAPFKDPSQYKVKRQNHGSGIGLGYCRVIVEGHGGRIWAESEEGTESDEGTGTTFFIELPCAPPGGPPRPSPPVR